MKLTSPSKAMGIASSSSKKNEGKGKTNTRHFAVWTVAIPT